MCFFFKQADDGGWTRRALAFGNEYANNGWNWWSNAGAEYTGGGQLQVCAILGA
jgi:hypothetical protein